MKKVIVFFKCFLVVFIIFMLSFIVCSAKASNSAYLLNIFDGFDRAVVVADASDLTIHDSIVLNGNQKFYSYQKNEEKLLANHLENSEEQGIVLYFSKDVKFETFQKIFKSNLTKSSKVEEMDVYYGYLPCYKKHIISGQKYINAQLVKSESGWVLGFPLILTGF